MKNRELTSDQTLKILELMNGPYLMDRKRGLIKNEYITFESKDVKVIFFFSQINSTMSINGYIFNFPKEILNKLNVLVENHNNKVLENIKTYNSTLDKRLSEVLFKVNSL